LLSHEINLRHDYHGLFYGAADANTNTKTSEIENKKRKKKKK
jgi:hypothetical protein